MNKVILKAQDLDGYLQPGDRCWLAEMDTLYERALSAMTDMDMAELATSATTARQQIISLFNDMGHLMQSICTMVPNLKVFSFETAEDSHAEASHVIAKLRNIHTDHHEFIYYSQRAFEMLFRMAYTGNNSKRKNHLVVQTPVTTPTQQYSVHKIPDIDAAIENTAMCVMLRGALLPSMIMSKEIEEYSSHGYVTPFALFKIKRDDAKAEADMEYILDLNNSYFDPEVLNGRDLIFADPMNATGGSLITIVKHLQSLGVQPKSIKVFNEIAALKGALRIVRALPDCTVYSLWMDPVLNAKAYIMPGLGDAGDRLNGYDDIHNQRNIIQLLADYGANIANLYRRQLRQIERTVLR